MKLLTFIILFNITFIKISHSENMLPLREYLKKNNNYNDKSRTLYILKRCTSLHYFLSNNKFNKKDTNIRIRYEKDYNFFSARIYQILNIKNSDFKKLNNKVDDEILRFSNIYAKDGKINLSKRGSNFKKSYILEDLKICSKIQ
tara:strand:+ start:397 stop:828 length:432 start_codon:yes stop_codon:yes gene_type:complete